MTAVNNNDVNMAKYIWHDILQTSPIPLSWGINFNAIKVIKNGTSFHVQGFKVTGQVEVLYEEGKDLFKVTVTPDDGAKPTTVEDVFCDTLISTIDEIVEKVPEYEKRVVKEYHLTMQKAV